MYDNTVPFTSDLINSYAWDTAIVFMQTFGTESNSATYSYQVGKGRLSTTGTGILSSTTKVDKQCNIFDMAGNCFEWTTETYSNSNTPCVVRGCDFSNSSIYTSSRNYKYNTTSHVDKNVSFRPLLYL